MGNRHPGAAPRDLTEDGRELALVESLAQLIAERYGIGDGSAFPAL